MKRWMLYSVCLLIIFSIYNDLMPKQPASLKKRSSLVLAEDKHTERTEKIYVVERTITPGDTLLSVIEEIHVHTSIAFDMETLINDFKKVNNGADPYQLQTEQTYYFPLYIR